MLGLAKRDITPIVSVYNTPRVGDGRPAVARRRRSTAYAPDPADYGDVHGGARDALLGHASRRPAARSCPRCATTRSGTSPTCSAFLAPQFEGGRARSRWTPTPRWTAAAYPAIKKANADARGDRRASAARAAAPAPTGIGAMDWLQGPARARHPARRLLPARLPGGRRRSSTPTVVPSWATHRPGAGRARRLEARPAPALHHRGRLHDRRHAATATPRSPRTSRPSTSPRSTRCPSCAPTG